MARSKSDIANSAIRIFLQDVGRYYDKARGFDPFGPKKAQKEDLLKIFNYECYCGEKITEKSFSQDHLIPMNKASQGLHAWGNVVPCCRSCNNEKQQKEWLDFLVTKSSHEELLARKKRVEDFTKEMNYDPNLNLHEYADNLYQDVGEVAMTLIKLRYEQAKDGIERLLRQ